MPPKYKSLEELADALADFGIVKDASVFSHWQNGRCVPQKLQDHLDLIKAFVKLDLIKDPAEANEWLVQVDT